MLEVNQLQLPEQHFQWSSLEKKCLSLLQRCQTRQTLLQIHAFVLRNAINTNPNVLSKFIMTCASFALSHHARWMFDARPQRAEYDTFLCNSMIKSHLGMSQFFESLTLYKDLKRDGCFHANNVTFTTLAKCCGSCVAIFEGFQLHCDVVKTGFCFDMFVLTGLVDMYGKFGEMGFAKKVFDEMPDRSVVSWTAFIGGYVRFGNMHDAKVLFDRMVEKDCGAYNVMIDGYVKVGEMDKARKLFDEMPERNVISWTSMIYGYCFNGDVESAKSLFDSMPEKNRFSWNVMIGGYCQNNQPNEALSLFHEMQESRMFDPDEVTILSVLPAIADLGALTLGGWVHQFIRRKKLDRSIKVCSALVDMYGKCGDVSKAKSVFNAMPQKEIASWNAMINGFAVNGCAKEASEAFSEMQGEGIQPNDVTLLGVLSACNHGGLVDEGKCWFERMDDLGLTPKIEHYGCLIDLLGKAGCLDEAEKLIKSMPYEINGIIISSFLFACWYYKDITRAKKILDQAVSVEPSNDANYVMLRNLYATEKRWIDVQEIKTLMRKNVAKKEIGCSTIETDHGVSEFISGGRMHPQWDAISITLCHLKLHMSTRAVAHISLYQ